MTNLSVPFWIFIILLVISEYQCQLGFFNSFLGTDSQQGRSLQPGLSLSPFSSLNDRNQNVNLRPQISTNTRRPINSNKLDQGTRGKLEEQKEKLEDILAKLQEMNKLKDEQRQKEQGTTTPKNVNNKPNVNNRPNINNNNQGTTSSRPLDESTKKPDVSRRWKKLMTKKCMFQMLPVVPEDQVSNYNMEQLLYYLE